MKAAHFSILNEFLKRTEDLKKHNVEIQARKRGTSRYQSTLKEAFTM